MTAVGTPHISNFEIAGKRYNIVVEHNGKEAKLDADQIAKITAIAHLLKADIEAKSIGDRIIKRVDSSGVQFTTGEPLSVEDPLHDTATSTMTDETRTLCSSEGILTTKSLLDAISRIITGTLPAASAPSSAAMRFDPVPLPPAPPSMKRPTIASTPPHSSRGEIDGDGLYKIPEEPQVDEITIPELRDDAVLNPNQILKLIELGIEKEKLPEAEKAFYDGFVNQFPEEDREKPEQHAAALLKQEASPAIWPKEFPEEFPEEADEQLKKIAQKLNQAKNLSEHQAFIADNQPDKVGSVRDGIMVAAHLRLFYDDSGESDNLSVGLFDV